MAECCRNKGKKFSVSTIQSHFSDAAQAWSGATVRHLTDDLSWRFSSQIAAFVNRTCLLQLAIQPQERSRPATITLEEKDTGRTEMESRAGGLNAGCSISEPDIMWGRSECSYRRCHIKGIYCTRIRGSLWLLWKCLEMLFRKAFDILLMKIFGGERENKRHL